MILCCTQGKGELQMREKKLIGVELASNFTTSCQISAESLIVSFVGADASWQGVKKSKALT
jgi:hypothetical protein